VKGDASRARGQGVHHGILCGQLAPVVACVRSAKLELLDGFKRHAAARQIAGMTLSVRVLEVDEPTAKAAILGLNRGQRATRELEEAWIVQGLVRDDGSGDPSYVNGAPTSG
jgi:hypothetical protein